MVLEFRTREFPWIATRQQPVVRRFDLITVDDFLLEHAVFIPDTIPDVGDIQRRHRIQVTGCQSPQTTVSQRGIRFVIDDFFHIDGQIAQGFPHIVGNIKRLQRILESAPDQKLHRKIINDLAALLVIGRIRFQPAFNQTVANSQLGSQKPVTACGSQRNFSGTVTQIV